MSTTLRFTGRPAQGGFSLIEMMIVVAIIGILLGVALPNYQAHVLRTNRAAAAGCVVELAQYMERVYASNLRYDLNGGSATTLPSTSCRTDLSTRYSFGFASGQPQARTFTVVATPQGVQATRDTDCGELRMDQANVRSVGGGSAAAACWK